MSDFVRWVTHGIKRSGFEASPRATRAALAAVAMLTLFAGCYLGLVSQTAARGRHIERLRAELIRLQRENEQLEADAATAGSMARLWERAEGLGFTLAGSVVYLAPDGAE